MNVCAKVYLDLFTLKSYLSFTRLSYYNTKYIRPYYEIVRNGSKLFYFTFRQIILDCHNSYHF